MRFQDRLVSLQARADRLVELAGVDLGQTRDSYPGCYSSPMKASSAPKKWYPTLNVYHTSTPLEIPDVGKATVEYRVTRRTDRVDGEDKKTHDYEIEIRSMEPIKTKDAPVPIKGKTRPGAPAMGSARTVALGALQPRMIQFDGRPRNDAGEYSPTDASSFTPAQATAAYGHPAVRQQISQEKAAQGDAILQRAIATATGRT